jgi:hypothetical protein
MSGIADNEKKKGKEGLSKPARDLLTRTTRLLSEQHRTKQNRRLKSAAFSAARQKAAQKFKMKVRTQAIASAGIDLAQIEQRQARDRQAVQEYRKQQAQDAMAGASEIRKKHVVATAARVTRLRDLAQLGGQATTYKLLEVAASIVASNPGIFSVVPLRSQLENIARLKVDYTGSGPFVGPSNFVFVDWHFSYVPPRTGLLNVVSSLLVNGFVYMETAPLWLIGGSASVLVDARISLYQPHQVLVGELVQDASDIFVVVNDEIRSDGLDCLGENRSYPLDEQQTLAYNNQFVVVSGPPVDIVVEVTLWPFEIYGSAVLDFDSSHDYGLNVPFVLTALT